MSDMEFKGEQPKSKAGESLFFYSMDYWIGLHRCIQMIIDEDFPSYPSMDEGYAEYLARSLEYRLDFGLVEAYYELATRRRLRNSGGPQEEVEEEVTAHVKIMLDWTRQYIEFLKNCGGCSPILQ